MPELLFFAEVGPGVQIWRKEDLRGGLFGANAGILISETGRWNRLYVGFSHFEGGEGSNEGRLGIGIQF